MVKLAVYNKQGNETEQIDLPDLFGQKVNTDVIHQAVVMYQACLRQGNASTKERADVSGGGKKPFKQKGGGRARAGSSRSPLWHGGGVTFGPHPRDFSYTIPKKIKKAALRESLNAKFQDNNILCIDDIKESFSKTKEFVQVLKDLNVDCKVLALLDGSDESIVRVTRNIRFFQLMRAQDVNAYDILRYKKLLVTKTALNQILDRINKEESKVEIKES